MPFTLDPHLEADSHFIAELPLCQLRLLDNRCFPWLLLVPRVAGAVEWMDLAREQQHQLSDEIAIVSHLFQALVTPGKLNIATLGNQVRQLHIHLIGRYAHDAAWPNPVWGGASELYETAEREKFIRELRMAVESAL